MIQRTVSLTLLRWVAEVVLLKQLVRLLMMIFQVGRDSPAILLSAVMGRWARTWLT